jgi:hypothetical protein
MPKTAAYTLHKGTGQARVRIDGKDHYLGQHDSAESRTRYDDLIADWLAKQNDPAGLTVAELALLYAAHPREHCRKGEELTSEFNCIQCSLRPLVAVHGDTLCRHFGPKALER